MATPFVKWVGGKRRVIPDILPLIPKTFNHYYEPFVGGGALFFHLRSIGRLDGHSVTLSDANLRLIRTYRAIRDDVDSVIRSLRTYKKLHSKEYFQEVRSGVVDGCSDTVVATWFIYLNKTCFNGMYRVNKNNEFNTPWNKNENPKIFDEENLRACSEALQGVDLRHESFVWALRRSFKGDFVYFDPPYAPVSVTSDFTSYTKDGFTTDDQVRLRNNARVLGENGVRVLLSNSDTPFVRELYQDFDITSIQVGRAINSKGSGRGKVGEVLISAKVWAEK